MYSTSALEVYMQFKKGDFVQYVGKTIERCYGQQGRLLGYREIGVETCSWDLKFNNPLYGTETVDESELMFICRKPDSHKRCECGAHAQQGFEDFHSDWCPMYQRGKF